MFLTVKLCTSIWQISGVSWFQYWNKFLINITEIILNTSTTQYSAFQPTCFLPLIPTGNVKWGWSMCGLRTQLHYFFYSHRHYVYVVCLWCQNMKKIRNCCFPNISCDMDLENHLSICNFFLTLGYFGLVSLAKLMHIFNNTPSQHTCRLCVCARWKPRPGSCIS